MDRKVGKDVAEALVDYSNNMARDDSDFVEQVVYRSHRTLQQSVFEMFLKLCSEWAKCEKEGCYDLRNEYTVKKAKEIMALMDGMVSTPFI